MSGPLTALWIAAVVAAVPIADVEANSEAPTPSVAVLPIEGQHSAREDARVRQCLIDGLRRGSTRVVDSPNAASVVEGSPDYVIRARVDRRDNVYEVRIQARNSGGELVASLDDVCEICGLAELTQLVENRTAALARQLSALDAANPIVTITSDPVGAVVSVDGNAVGNTPLQHELTPGEHVIELRKKGHASQRRTISMVAGVERELSVALAETVRDRRPVNHRRLRVGGVIGLVAGAAVVGAGAALLGIDERPYRGDCRADAAGNCARLYDTLVPGAVLTAVGSAALVTGAVLLGVGLRGGRRDNDRVAWSRTGIGVRF